ncbi:hypothetical protein [Micromonospora olivasterospora]|uniref:hypothetical protein n=1 Tax=Micromonospora olivasterospora TaxID=1880 RepID=UPI001FE640B0|nr:hypothetical protein [Micromonospora olivasterospora]
MSGAVHAGHAPPTGPSEPTPTRRRSRWLLAATVAWAVLLAALTWVSVRTDGPTVREQRTLAQAGPVADWAVGELVAAAGGRVVTLAPDRVASGCRVTPLLDGATLERAVEVMTGADEPRAVLEHVADRLPAAWRAGVLVSDEGPRLRADAGEFVAVAGRPAGDGRVRLTVRTGCRPSATATARPQDRAARRRTRSPPRCAPWATRPRPPPRRSPRRAPGAARPARPASRSTRSRRIRPARSPRSPPAPSSSTSPRCTPTARARRRWP